MRLTKAERETARARRMQHLREAQAIVAKGNCPNCGTKLYRNNSLTGWWQCGHLGAIGFQREASEQHCHFQTFFDPDPSEWAKLEAEKTCACGGTGVVPKIYPSGYEPCPDCAAGEVAKARAARA